MEARIYYKIKIISILFIILFNSEVRCQSEIKPYDLYTGKNKFIPGTEYYVLKKQNDKYILNIYIVVKSSFFQKKDTLTMINNTFKGNFCTIEILDNKVLKLIYDSEWKYSNDKIHNNIVLYKARRKDLKNIELIKEKKPKEVIISKDKFGKYFFNFDSLQE